MNVIIVTFVLFSFLIVWQFGGHNLGIALISLKSNMKEKSYLFQPFVSISVPSHNEDR